MQQSERFLLWAAIVPIASLQQTVDAHIQVVALLADRHTEVCIFLHCVLKAA